MKKELSFSEWWSIYGIYCIIFGCLLLILLFYLFRPKHDSSQSDIQYNISKDYTKSPRKSESKGEQICREVATRLFRRPFQKIRPAFLRNDRTGNNLEIDIFNDELQLGIEYNGRQHYEFTPYFHKNEQAFLDQKYRDELKYKRCKERGIRLIVVPHTIKHENIESYIRQQARQYGYSV